MLLSKSILISGVAAAALALPAFAEEPTAGQTSNQQLSQQNQDQSLDKAGDKGAIGPTKPTSGPGVQGAPDTRTGPATHGPGGTPVKPDTGSDTSTTHPTQDSSGVQGFPDTRTGPSTRSPD
ncbi:hypothetical protein [Hyphomicrobium sp.]|uniref:hypothetical protein n=1 Tax=Hyphomicrobium sp. TaxID=82 RepID=UPI002FDCA449